MIADAESLYERVYPSELSNTSNFIRHCMASACLLTVGRQNSIGLSVPKMASHIPTKPSNKSIPKITLCLRKLRENYDVVHPNISLSDNIGQILQQAGMSMNVIKLSEKIAQCMEKALLTQGRPGNVLAFPVAYFAWHSCNFQANSKETFPQFCKKFGVKVTNTLFCRKTEIQNLLEAMVKELPWVSPDTKNIYPYIADALQYESSLLSKAIETKVSSVESKAEVSQNDKENDEITNDVICNDNSEISVTKTEQEVTPVFKLPEKGGDIKDKSIVFRKCPRKRRRNVDVDMNIPRKIRAMDSDDSGDEILLGSDDDTDQYIVSAEEVKERNKVMKLYDTEDEDELVEKEEEDEDSHNENQYQEEYDDESE